MLALVLFPLAAQPGPAQASRRDQISRVLDLTEAQKASIRAIRDKHRPDLILRRDAMRHAGIDLRTALQDATTPEPKLRALYDKAAAARFDMILARRSLRLEVQATLTPAQRAQAAEMRDRGWPRRGEPMRGPMAHGMAG
jgi:Spy/CpxP family protein refolding chaperone